MSGIQNFARKFLPASWAASMEKESREWMLRCQGCGAERSVWEMGGIRWKAAGNPTRLMHCGHCGALTRHTTYKKWLCTKTKN
jgi:rRNA maturation endonuclease Nob1